MLSRLRTLLMWLAMFAIPVQGFVAASSACEPAHQARTTHVAMAHHHDHAHPAAYDAVDHAAHAPADVGGATCAHCAACCTGVAVFPVAPAFASAAPSGAVFYDTAPAVIAFLTSGVERPPRLSASLI